MALALFTGPVYLAAAVAQVPAARSFVVTAKGTATVDAAHLPAAPAVADRRGRVPSPVEQVLHHDYPTLYLWADDHRAHLHWFPLVHVVARNIPPRRCPRLARLRSVLGHRRVGELLVPAGPAHRRRSCAGLLDLQATREEAWLRLGELAVPRGYLDGDELAEALDTARVLPQEQVSAERRRRRRAEPPPRPRDDNAAGAECPGRPSCGEGVELRGFEPLTPSMRTRCATGLRYSPSGDENTGLDARGL